jgi:exodeoxyribonuclease VIII
MNYHDHPALSASKLKQAVTGTALDYWARYVDSSRKPFTPSDAMRQGSLVDCMLTQPAELTTRYMTAPSVDRRTKAGKEEWSCALQAAAANGSELISEDWMVNATSICRRLCSDPTVSLYLGGAGQAPFFWYDTEFAVDCRYMPDCEIPERGLLVDLKKARDASPRGFHKQAYALAYDLQMAHYAEGYRERYGEYPREIALVAYEWDWPHNCAVHVLTAEMLDEGRRRREEAIVLIKQCEATGMWPSWGRQEFDVPRWAVASDPANATDLDDLGLEGLE